MAKQKIACADVMPGCKFEAEAETENELLEKVSVHAAEVHGVKEVTPDLVAKVKSVIKSVD